MTDATAIPAPDPDQETEDQIGLEPDENAIDIEGDTVLAEDEGDE